MSTQRTKCLFCRRQYVQAGAYEKHLRSKHGEFYDSLYKSLPNNASRHGSPTHSYERSSDAEELDVPGEQEVTVLPPGVNQSDYESDQESELSASEEHASDGEENLEPISSNAENRTDDYEGAGCPLRSAGSERRLEEGLLDDPWYPFRTLGDFKLARWFIMSKVPRSRIDEYFASGLSASSTPCFRSAYKLDQYINGLDPYQDLLEWNEATFEHDGRSSVFFYRNIVHCVEYLLAQPAYRQDIVYGPIREYDGSGQRLYSEMHTADWWWQTQVR